MNIALLITIIVGVTVYVVGRFLESLFIVPMSQLNEVRSDIADKILFHGNKFTQSQDLPILKSATDELRTLSTQLRAKAYLIPWYRFWELVRFVPKQVDIEECSQSLMFLSNSVGEKEPNYEKIHHNILTTRHKLGLYLPYQQEKLLEEIKASDEQIHRTKTQN